MNRMRGFFAVYVVSSLWLISGSEANQVRDYHEKEVVIDADLNWVPTGKDFAEPRVIDSSDSSFLSPEGTGTAPPSAVGYGIEYHGRKIVGGVPNIYFIWYGNWQGNTAPGILTDFINGLAGSSYLNILRNYSTSATTISGTVAYVKAIYDNYSQGKTLTDLGVWKVVNNAIQTHLLPSDANGIYFVLASKDVDESSGFCKSYCGWHSSSGGGPNSVRYAFIGDMSRCPSTCAAQKVSPNGNVGADAMASTIAHELVETITDPDFGAWYDKNGKEAADKCAWNFGPSNSSPAGYRWNVKLGARQFYIQQIWVNAQKGSGSTLTHGYCGLGN